MNQLCFRSLSSAAEYILMGHKISELCLTPPAVSQAKLSRPPSGLETSRVSHLLLLALVLLAVGLLELLPGVGVVRVGGHQGHGGHQEAQDCLHDDHSDDLNCFVCVAMLYWRWFVLDWIYTDDKFAFLLFLSHNSVVSFVSIRANLSLSFVTDFCQKNYKNSWYSQVPEFLKVLKIDLRHEQYIWTMNIDQQQNIQSISNKNVWKWACVILA